jgi:hypothetical protein
VISSYPAAIIVLFWALAVPMAMAKPCLPPVGADVAVQSDKRFLIFGETHGTQEMPRAFGEIVCAVAVHRPVVVTLEYPEDDTPAFAAYLASRGSAADRARLFEDAKWGEGKQDGRKSRAMFEMVERLRVLRARGAEIDIATHLKVRPKSVEDHEAGMAAGLVSVSGRFPKAQVLSLVGSSHAIRLPGAGGTRGFPMAAQLPEGQVFSVSFIGQAGTAWVCVSGKDAPMVCGAHALSGRSRATPPDILLQRRGYDAEIEVGPMTASLPAAMVGP